MAPIPVLLPGKSHGRRSLVGCSPWDCEESETTKQLHFHFSLSCIGEGNGNPLHCFCWRIPGTGEPGGLPSRGCAELDTTEVRQQQQQQQQQQDNINLFLLLSSPVTIPKWDKSV